MPGLKNKAMKHKGNRVYIHVMMKNNVSDANSVACLSYGDKREPKVGTWMQAKKFVRGRLRLAKLIDVKPCQCGMHASDTLEDARQYTDGLVVGDVVCLVELKGNVQAHVRNHYAIVRVVDKYVALYRKVVGMRKIAHWKEQVWLNKNAANNTKIRKWILKQYKGD